MKTWREVRDDLNQLSEEQLDMAASVVVDVEGGICLGDNEDGIEINDGIHPDLCENQPYLRVDVS